MFSGAGLRRVLVGAVVFIGVAQTASGSSASRLRARQSQQHQQQQQVQNGNSKASGPEYQHGRRLTNGDGGEVAVPDQGRFGLGLPQQQSLKSTRDPQCNLPEELSCTLNTTAIGMVENGFATYYDDTCGATGAEGCYTDGIPECRTCYLSTEVYMAATNTSDNSRPSWVMCPCCVPTTLEDNHFDIEVMAFDYSVFNISESACTDAPTPAPAPTGAVTTTSPAAADAAPTAPSPSAEPATPAPMAAPMAAPTVDGVGATSAPEAASRALGTPAPSETTTTDSMATTSIETTPAPSAVASSTSGTSATTDVDVDDDGVASEAGTKNLDTSGGDDGLSMGAKVGIGAGAAVGVIILGAAGFGIMKASNRS